jgi:hypothetical protein
MMMRNSLISDPSLQTGFETILVASLRSAQKRTAMDLKVSMLLRLSQT